jgi:hypothetical protein
MLECKYPHLIGKKFTIGRNATVFTMLGVRHTVKRGWVYTVHNGISAPHTLTQKELEGRAVSPYVEERAMKVEADSIEDKVEQEWQDTWQNILYNDGVLDLQQLKRELFDAAMIVREVNKVYCELTEHQLSKPNTSADAVIRMVNRSHERDKAQSMVDELEALHLTMLDTDVNDIDELRQLYTQAKKLCIESARSLEKREQERWSQ